MKFDLDHSITILGQTPSALRALLEGLPETWVRSNEGPETWSPYDIIGHLIHGEETDWLPRLRIIIEHGESKPFTPFDRFAQFENSRGQTLGQLLDHFETLRVDNLSALQGMNLEPHQLELRGTHPELGTVTAAQLLATWAVHDLAHIAQIARILARNYSSAVGPWREYLSILGPATD